MTSRHAISDRHSAGRAAEAAVDELGLAPGGLRDALRQAVREVAYNAADWAGGGEVALERTGSGAQIVVLEADAAVLAGFDFPIGLPARYAAKGLGLAGT